MNKVIPIDRKEYVHPDVRLAKAGFKKTGSYIDGTWTYPEGDEPEDSGMGEVIPIRDGMESSVQSQHMKTRFGLTEWSIPSLIWRDLLKRYSKNWVIPRECFSGWGGI